MSAHVGRNSKIHTTPISTASAYACSPQVRIVAANRNDRPNPPRRAQERFSVENCMHTAYKRSGVRNGRFTPDKRAARARAQMTVDFRKYTHTRVVRESGHTAMLRIGFREIRCARIRFDYVLCASACRARAPMSFNRF